MTILSLPVRSDILNYNFQTVLDGVQYDLYFFYNYREESWELSISQNGQQQLEGIRIVNGLDLLNCYKYNPNIPQGKLNCIDLTGKYSDPTQTNFGSTTLLQYTTVN